MGDFILVWMWGKYVSPLHDRDLFNQFLGDVWDEAIDGQAQWSAIRHSMLQTYNEMLARHGKK